MTFEKLIESKEHKILAHTEKYLYLKFEPYRLLFYFENNELNCFSLELFKKLTPYDLYELLYSYSITDFVDVSNKSTQNLLHFSNSNLSDVLGECLSIISLDRVEPEAVIDPESLQLIKTNHHIVPTANWKFSQRNQLWYFVSNSICIEFDSNHYTYYGDNSYFLNCGQEDVRIYLNPFTLWMDYKRKMIHTYSNIQFGYDNQKNATLVYRGNHNELTSVLKIVCSKLNTYYTVEKGLIKLHLIHFDFMTFNNDYLKKLNDIYSYDINMFELSSEKKITKKLFKILPGVIDKNRYPILICSSSVTHIQIALEICFKELLDGSIDLDNITYTVPSVFELKQDFFIENPNPQDYDY